MARECCDPVLGLTYNFSKARSLAEDEIYHFVNSHDCKRFRFEGVEEVAYIQEFAISVPDNFDEDEYPAEDLYQWATDDPETADEDEYMLFVPEFSYNYGFERAISDSWQFFALASKYGCESNDRVRVSADKCSELYTARAAAEKFGVTKILTHLHDEFHYWLINCGFYVSAKDEDETVTAFCEKLEDTEDEAERDKIIEEFYNYAIATDTGLDTDELADVIDEYPYGEIIEL